MLLEFIYCHLYITDTIALSILNNKRRKDLMSELILSLEYSVVESVYEGWDEKLKGEFRSHFIEGLSESF
jgi:hypothetical protein